MPGPHRIFAGSSRPFCFTRTRSVSRPVASNSQALLRLDLAVAVLEAERRRGARGHVHGLGRGTEKRLPEPRVDVGHAGLDIERADPGARSRHHLLGRAAGVLVAPERPGHEPGAAVAERDAEVGSGDLDPPLALVGHRRHRRRARRAGALGGRRSGLGRSGRGERLARDRHRRLRLRRRSRKQQAVRGQHEQRHRDGEQQTTFIHLQGILAVETLRDGVDAPARERLAAREAEEREACAAPGAVLLDRLLGVDAAARPEAAVPADER